MACDFARQCLVGGNCVESGTINEVNSCLVCDPVANPRTWTAKEDCDTGSGLTDTELIVLIVLVVVFVLCILLIIAICCRRYRRREMDKKLGKSLPSSRRLSQFSNQNKAVFVPEPGRLGMYPYPTGYGNPNTYDNGMVSADTDSIQRNGRVTTVAVGETSTPSMTGGHSYTGYATMPVDHHRRYDTSHSGPTMVRLHSDVSAGGAHMNGALQNGFVPVAIPPTSGGAGGGGGAGRVDIHSDIPPGPTLLDTRTLDSHRGHHEASQHASASINVHDNAAIKIPLGFQTLPIEISQKKKKAEGVKRSSSTETLTKAIDFEEHFEMNAEAKAYAFGGSFGHTEGHHHHHTQKGSSSDETYTIVAQLGLGDEGYQQTTTTTSNDDACVVLP